MYNSLIEKMYAEGGYRERYAMDNGNGNEIYVGGKLCIQYTYGDDVEYQDANGATYCVKEGRWIG